MNDRNVLVLGAAGFIGRHTSRKFAENGCRVIGLGHGSWQKEEWASWGLSEFLSEDISKESIDFIASDHCFTAVVQCAGSGSVSYSYKNPLEDFERAIQSTGIALDWIRTRNPRNCRFVFVSSAAVYGDKGPHDSNELTERVPISPYGFHKVAAELICESYSNFFDVPVSIVRLFSVFGEGLRKQLFWDALNKIKIDDIEFFGTGDELRDWIYVEDAAELLVRSALIPQSLLEIYNGGAHHSSIRDVLALLLGDLNFIAFTGDVHPGNPRRLTSNSLEAFYRLGWEPKVSLEEGVRRYLEWYNGYMSLSSH